MPKEKQRSKKNKGNSKPLSVYPLKVEEVVEAMLKTPPLKIQKSKKKARKPSGDSEP